VKQEGSPAVFDGLPASAGSAAVPAMPLNSWHFLVICVAAVLVVRGLPVGLVRKAALAAVNLYFLFLFVWGLYPLAALLVLLLATYGLGELKVRCGDRIPGGVWTLVIAALWVLLFLVKDPNLASGVNPFSAHPLRLVGISYLVFRSIHYIADAECLEGRSLLTFVNYAIFFPTFLAGPIERYERFQVFHDSGDPQAPMEPLPIFHRIANGLVKKYVLADNLLAWGSLSHPPADQLAPPMLWLSVMSLLVLLYLDFSGYCDIVIGVAALMGFRLMENFNRPFLATSVQDFWTRWHISLTSIVRDYVFTPLSHFVVYHFSRRWQFPLACAVYFFAMMLIALWHNTTWGFFVFGLLHGAMLVGLQVFRRYGYPRLGRGPREFFDRSPLVAWGSRAMNYAFVSFTMLFWQYGPAESVSILGRMVGWQP